jgi:hypothetical protein
MAPYIFSFLIDAESLLLGMTLGVVAGWAVVMIIENFQLD